MEPTTNVSNVNTPLRPFGVRCAGLPSAAERRSIAIWLNGSVRRSGGELLHSSLDGVGIQEGWMRVCSELRQGN